MDKARKWITLSVISVAVVFLAVTAVTASPKALSTPLHTFRMEQASSRMNFSPGAMNGFTYVTGNGYILNHGIPKGSFGDAEPLKPCTRDVCPPTNVNTCGSTCPSTCDWTCASTCSSTCVSTCSTCVGTCPSTCVSTCSTCVSTCSGTCVGTCWTCVASCGGTCASTCSTCYDSCVPEP